MRITRDTVRCGSSFLLTLLAFVPFALAQQAEQPAGKDPQSSNRDSARELSRESWKLLEGKLTWLALSKSESAYAAACEQYPECSWQRKRAALELADISKICQMSASDKEQFFRAFANHRRDRELVHEGKVEEALEVATGVLAEFQQLLGSDSCLAVDQMGHVATIYRWVGENEKAHDLWCRTLAICERTRAKGDPDLLVSRVGKAYCETFSASDFPQAERTLLSAIEEAHETGASLALLGFILDRLVTYYTAVGRHASALKWADERRKLTGAGNPDKWDSLSTDFHYALCLAYNGRFEEAERLLDATFAKVEAKSTYPVGERRSALLIKAKVLLLQGRHEAAELTLEQAQALNDAVQRGQESNAQYYYSDFLLGEVMFRKGRLADAEKVLERGLQRCAKRLGGDHPTMLSALDLLSQTKKALGKQTEAAELVARHARLSANAKEPPQENAR